MKQYGPKQTKAFIAEQEDKLAKALAASQAPDTDDIVDPYDRMQPRKVVGGRPAKKVKALDPDDPKNDPRYAERLAKAKAVMQVFDHVREWFSDPNDSSSGATYRQLLQADGKLSCDCPGWRNYSGGTAKRVHRDCKHQKDIVNELRLVGKKFEVRAGLNDAWLCVIGMGGNV